MGESVSFPQEGSSLTWSPPWERERERLAADIHVYWLLSGYENFPSFIGSDDLVDFSVTWKTYRYKKCNPASLTSCTETSLSSVYVCGSCSIMCAIEL